MGGGAKNAVKMAVFRGFLTESAIGLAASGWVLIYIHSMINISIL